MPVVISGENLLGPAYSVYTGANDYHAEILSRLPQCQTQTLLVLRDHGPWLRSLYNEYVWEQHGSLNPTDFAHEILAADNFSWLKLAYVLLRQDQHPIVLIWCRTLSESASLAVHLMVDGSISSQSSRNTSPPSCCTFERVERRIRGEEYSPKACDHSDGDRAAADRWILPADIAKRCLQIDTEDRKALTELSSKSEMLNFYEHLPDSDAAQPNTIASEFGNSPLFKNPASNRLHKPLNRFRKFMRLVVSLIIVTGRRIADL